MPHVSVKIVGKTEAEKELLAQAITRAVVSIAQCDETAISLTIEDVEQSRWIEDVYEAEIVPNWGKLYKTPGYGPQPVSAPGDEAGSRR